MKNQKGITLVALVITIIVLLILSAVTINLTLGERGIFNIAQKAAKNYTDAAVKEETDLNNFQNEINNTLNGISSGVITKPEEPKEPTLASKITAANYGDYVNYPVVNGSTSKGHTTDWRIFYKDEDGYVYLIASYYLPYVRVPSGTDLQNYSSNGQYISYWTSAPGSYTEIAQATYDRYKMNFKYNGSPNNNQPNMRCVSQLMNTSVWSKFVNTTYALDAIGAPTLEMWVESWNAKSMAKNAGWTTLNVNIPNENGYYINNDSWIDLSSTTGFYDTLYFPVITSTAGSINGFHYLLSSPSADSPEKLMCITFGGGVYFTGYNDVRVSVRPVIRLKNTVDAEFVNGVWNLKN